MTDKLLQPNVTDLLNTFNNKLDEEVNKIKKQMENELLSQINRNDFMCKLNRVSDSSLFEEIKLDKILNLFDEDYTEKFQSSFWDTNQEKKIIIKINHSVYSKLQDGEYIINFKYQIHNYIYFLLLITNFGTVVAKLWEINYDEIMACVQQYRHSLRSGHVSNMPSKPQELKENIRKEIHYEGKNKIDDDVLFILNGMIDVIFPFIPPNIDGYWNELDKGDKYKPYNQYQTNCVMNEDTGRINKYHGIVHVVRFQNVIDVIKKYQDNYVMPLINQTAQQIIEEKQSLDLERNNLNMLDEENEQTMIKLLERENDVKKDLEKYANIKEFEEKYTEIQKYKSELDEYAKKLNDDRNQYEIEKARVEKQKIEIKVSKINIGTSFASFLTGYDASGGN